MDFGFSSPVFWVSELVVLFSMNPLFYQDYHVLLCIVVQALSFQLLGRQRQKSHKFEGSLGNSTVSCRIKTNFLLGSHLSVAGAPVMTSRKKPVVFLAIHFSRTLGICKLTGRCCQRLLVSACSYMEELVETPTMVKETG